MPYCVLSLPFLGLTNSPSESEIKATTKLRPQNNLGTLKPLRSVKGVTASGSPQSSSSASVRKLRHESGSLNKHLKKFTGLYTGPYFDQNGNPGNVTVQLGETAMLPCRVKQRGEKTVIMAILDL